MGLNKIPSFQEVKNWANSNFNYFDSGDARNAVDNSNVSVANADNADQLGGQLPRKYISQISYGYINRTSAYIGHSGDGATITSTTVGVAKTPSIYIDIRGEWVASNTNSGEYPGIGLRAVDASNGAVIRDVGRIKSSSGGTEQVDDSLFASVDDFSGLENTEVRVEIYDFQGGNQTGDDTNRLRVIAVASGVENA